MGFICLFVLTASLTNENLPFIVKEKKKKAEQVNKFKHHYFKNRSILFISLLKLVTEITKYGISLINSDTFLHLHLKGANFHWEYRSISRVQFLSPGSRHLKLDEM